jgi:hypothetical protein
MTDELEALIKVVAKVVYNDTKMEAIAELVKLAYLLGERNGIMGKKIDLKKLL